MQWILMGALIGGILAWGFDAGAIGGAILGALLGGMRLVSQLQSRLEALSATVRELAREQQAMADRLARLASQPEPNPTGDDLVFELDPLPGEAGTAQATVRPWAGKASGATGRETAAPPRTGRPAPEQSRGKPWASLLGSNPLLDRIRHFFTTGNVVARVGSVVLFFGLGFLLKHAAERAAFSIEIKLAAVALLGIGLLAAGWRLRRRQGYGLILQGAGVGTLYLTTFTALRFYELLPNAAAFVLMLLVVGLTVALALLQNSRALVSLGMAGGFLAPILTSSGEGSHVLLFSYYALLNAGILVIAWHRAWRSLNLLGFAFTFIIGALWGHEAYRPELFATTQPFLMLFFLFYLTISVLFAHRQPPQLKGYLDGTLVFGLPLAAFALQAALVWEFEYGLAFSALALAVTYACLAALLWRRQVSGTEVLTRVFAILAGLFATLTVPFAFDNQVTAAAWALEGAALVWLGSRQQRLLERVAGLALQAGAGAAFAWVMADLAATPVLVNGLFLGAVILAVAGFWSSVCLERAGHNRVLPAVLLGWGLLWWLNASLGELGRHLDPSHYHHGVVLVLALSALVLERLSRRLGWTAGAYPALGLLPVLAVMALDHIGRPAYLPGIDSAVGQELLLSPWGVAWLTAAAVHLNLLYRRESSYPPGVVRLWHMGGLWLGLAVLSHDLASLAYEYTPQASESAWPLLSWALAPALALYVLIRRRTPAWPLGIHRDAYGRIGLLPVAGVLTLWVLGTSVRLGSAPPLPYLPLLNPLEMAQALVILTLLRGWQRLWRSEAPFAAPAWLIPLGIGFCAFAALNGILARSVHYIAGVDYTWEALFGAIEFQSGLSILWTCLALAAMGLAGRHHNRALWYLGAGLLGLVVIKLFLIELANAGTVGRIVSFLVVGLLMLLIGYLSPLPPHRAGQARPDAAGRAE